MLRPLLGPNGCGKSNVVDAVKWVLGEQSARNMRAERMEDVIFSGTENRKALNVAEVILIIENETGILDFERPEISIRRRIFRDSDSEYFLNGNPVRLKEIRELFFDTGVGKSAYSVMEQGKIDQVLSNKPENRRHLFEEAAGITKYRMRGQEAETRLANTEDNMNQVQRILQEVERNYENLKQQMQNTLKYRELRERSFEIDRDIKLIRWKAIENNRSQISMRMGVKVKKRGEIAGKLTEIKASMADKLDAVNAMNSHLLNNQKFLFGIGVERENQEKLLKSIRDRRGQLEESLKSYGSKEKSIQQILKEIEERKRYQEKELQGFNQRLKEIETGIALCGDTIAAAEKHISMTGNNIETQSWKLTDEEIRREALQEELRILTDNIVQELDRHLSDWGQNQSVRRHTEERIYSMLKELNIRLEGRSMHFSDMGKGVEGRKMIELLEDSAKELNSLLAMLREVIDLFDECRAMPGDFLEEFLAPEGIITQKREYDEQVIASAEKIQGFKEQIAALETERAALAEKIQTTRKGMEEFRIAQARATTQMEAAKERLLSFERESAAEKKRLADIQGQISSEQYRISSLDREVEELARKREELEERQKQIQVETAKLESNISTENRQMAEREKKIISLSERLADMELDRGKIQIQMENLDREEKQLLEEFRDRHSRELADFADLKAAIRSNPEKLKKEQVSIKEQLKTLGRVNLMAPEEFGEISERRNFLSSQLSDLKKAKEDLSRIKAEILKESSEVFLQTFNQIHKNFHEMFRKLFGGGKAKIHLIKPEEPLDSGLEIYVQPPGKKLENLSLLSGGEKALCGIALLFATFMVKPSPFCILDEIDAALDETNIQNFVNVLTDFGKKSQFIIITHNKKTVSGARNLLGVTMQESGVSRIISLKLNSE